MSRRSSIFRPFRWLSGVGIGIGVIAVVGAGCDRTSPAAVAPPPPPAVTVARPLVREAVEQDEYTGRLASVESVDVRARVGGYVDSIHFVDGQTVQKGDLLYVIDPRPYKAALDVALGEVKQAQSGLDLAMSDFERAKGLVNTRALSKEDFDTRAKRAEAAAATLTTAEARSTRAKLDVEFTEVRAPMAGRIARHLISVGNLIAGGSADSTVLVNIVSADPIYAYFDIDEQSYLKYLRSGDGDKKSAVFQNASTVEMAVLGETGFRHRGRLNFVDNQIDNATGTLRARAVFENKGLSLSPGVFVKIRLAGSAPFNAVMLPDRALQADQSDRFVYVVGKDNVVQQRPVTPGRLYEGLRIITAGLDGSEHVIVDGVQRARPGTPVTPEQTQLAMPPAAATPDQTASVGGIR